MRLGKRGFRMGPRPWACGLVLALLVTAPGGHVKAGSSGSGHGAGSAGVTAADALKRLSEGNRRYVSGESLAAERSPRRRGELAQGQHPFAIVVGCSDSRVPPEIVFDQGLGDLFVVRTAGNIVDDIGIGSVEYAVEHLGVRLVMVLGHERCGAVGATVAGGEAPGHLKAVVGAIAPAVEKARGKHGDLVDDAVRANAEAVAVKLSSSGPILSEAVKAGQLKIVGAYYDLDTGAVSVIDVPMAESNHAARERDGGRLR